ncbi:MAG: tyrosine-type recombinase/integrase [Myxococcales bacterium]
MVADELISNAIVPAPANAISAKAMSLLICLAGPRAEFAWDEFFSGQLANRHTKAAYLFAVRRFLTWAERRTRQINDITPGMIGIYFGEHPGSLPTKKLHLAALRAFFDLLVNRHVIILNPAATVRTGKHQAVEGKTPAISPDQARALLQSISGPSPTARRDRAILSTLIYTAARDGAVAALRIKDLKWDGTQYKLRFLEKGGKERLIPVRYNLQLDLLQYLECFVWQDEPSDAPLFRSVAGRTGQLTKRPFGMWIFAE